MEGTALRHAMARVPGPVTVVTTIDGTGERWGFTANSFTSVSLDPPLVLVCLNKNASTHQAFTSADRFLINVLAHGQDAVARRFARSGVDRFAAGDMESCELGLPGSHGACARVACTMHSIVDAGDHSILIGRVVDTYADDRTPLVYYDRTFACPAPATAAGAEEPVKILHLADW
ncbi:flavin reductase family protein [Streptomyces sp. NPDC001093]|uniref:flavin reductase family protein n=1 Tax=Streptomyces sp. NPDC001093 TaxID=3154376 RepID=UPI00331BDE49